MKILHASYSADRVPQILLFNSADPSQQLASLAIITTTSSRDRNTLMVKQHCNHNDNNIISRTSEQVPDNGCSGLQTSFCKEYSNTLNNMLPRTFRRAFLITFWAVQSALLLANSANALQTLRPSRTTQRHHQMKMYQSHSALDDHPISDFQKRLLSRMNNGSKNIKAQNSISTRNAKSPFIQEVRTLKEYKRVVVDEKENDQLVVVWFYSPWCRSCKGVSKGFQALSREYQKDIKFVQVPVLSDNATLHQGLGVKSVPFVHVYHPTEGLVEERKLTRKYLPGFHRLLQDYRKNECSLEQLRIGDDQRWSTDSPYEPAPKSIDKEEETVLDD